MPTEEKEKKKKMIQVAFRSLLSSIINDSNEQGISSGNVSQETEKKRSRKVENDDNYEKKKFIHRIFSSKDCRKITIEFQLLLMSSSDHY